MGLFWHKECIQAVEPFEENIMKQFLVAAALLAFCLVAHADDKPGKFGKVRYKELKAALDAQLTELDKDKDGKLDHGEVHKALRALRKTLDGMPDEAEYDADHDGKIERKELKEKIDADHDNKIDHGEGREALLKFKQEHPTEWQSLLERVATMRNKNKDRREDRKERREERKEKKD